MLIAFAMAGRSQRFRNAGYNDPKHELPLGDRTMFDHAVSGFKRYFTSADFLFITRDDRGSAFAATHAQELGITNAQTVQDPDPQGFVGSVIAGLQKTDFDLNQPVLMPVIDTFRPDFKLPEDLGNSSFSEFYQVGPKNQLPSEHQPTKPYFIPEPPPGELLRVPKGRLHFLPWVRGDGLHFFQSAELFVEAHRRAHEVQQKWEWAGLGPKSKPGEWSEWLRSLSEIRKMGQSTDIYLANRSDIIFCGVPAEYEAIRNNEPLLQRLQAASTAPR